jgi:hypothetical protein
VRGVQRSALDLGSADVGHAAGFHERQRLGDPVRHVAVTLALRRALDEAEHPAVHPRERRVAAIGEGAQEIERRRRLGVGLDLARRIRHARLLLELEPIDDIAAIARQLDRALALGRRRTGLGELTGHAADLDHRHRRAEGQDHRHLQQHAQRVADVVGMELGERLRTVPALQQERFAGAHVGELLLQIPRLAGEHQRRITRQLRLDPAERCGIGVVGHLRCAPRAPARGSPVGSHHGPLVLLRSDPGGRSYPEA